MWTWLRVPAWKNLRLLRKLFHVAVVLQCSNRTLAIFIFKSSGYVLPHLLECVVGFYTILSGSPVVGIDLHTAEPGGRNRFLLSAKLSLRS